MEFKNSKLFLCFGAGYIKLIAYYFHQNFWIESYYFLFFLCNLLTHSSNCIARKTVQKLEECIRYLDLPNNILTQ
jgi:hypothetical protein